MNPRGIHPILRRLFCIFRTMTRLDEILTELDASNHELVEMDSAHLNHKMVQKARLGKKPVPRHTQELILNALNNLVKFKEVENPRTYKRVELFPFAPADDAVETEN